VLPFNEQLQAGIEAFNLFVVLYELAYRSLMGHALS